jgi:uncharacterized OB-fold protein
MPKRKQKSYSWAYRARHLQRGLCGDCPRKAEPGKTLCRRHGALVAKKQHSIKAARIAAGRCRSCGHKLCASEAGRRICYDCHEKSVNRLRMGL